MLRGVPSSKWTHESVERIWNTAHNILSTMHELGAFITDSQECCFRRVPCTRFSFSIDSHRARPFPCSLLKLPEAFRFLIPSEGSDSVSHLLALFLSQWLILFLPPAPQTKLFSLDFLQPEFFWATFLFRAGNHLHVINIVEFICSLHS